MNKQTFKGMFIMSVMLILLSSCAGTRDGYGCKGKESWNKMVRRINNGYRP